MPWPFVSRTATCRDEVDLQRRLSLHPNVVRFMGACCHIPSTGRPFQDDTLDNWQVRIHNTKPRPTEPPAQAVSHVIVHADTY